MQNQTPPVTIIRTSIKNGSMGYGAKRDGNKLCIPYNVLIAEKFKGLIMNVVQVDRIWFSDLPMYEGE